MIITHILSKLEQLNSNNNWELILEPWLRTELTYTSNSLEGNTLSLVETGIVINDKQGISGKNLREIYEATNHANAWDYIIINLKQIETSDLTETHFLDIHNFILKNIDEYNAGRYRSVAVRIMGSMTIFANPLEVPELMEQTIIWLSSQSTSRPEHIITTAIMTHLKLVKIHPFTDGNGRTVRLLMNTILMQNNLPPIDVLPINRQKYLEALENSTEQNPELFVSFMLEQYSQNLYTYLQTF
jgi:Fic family protein